MIRIFIPVFLLALIAHATTPSPACIDPFAGEQTQFELTEPLSCDPAQAVYQLQISPGVYLQPSCVGDHKVIDLYLNNGQNIQSFSTEETGQPGWGTLTVESACTGQNLFTIEPGFQVPGIGTVNPAENTANGLILRNNQTQIMANATKKLISGGNCGQAVWKVENSPTVSPQVTAYLLALKDNSLFRCHRHTSEPEAALSRDLSTAQIVGICTGIAASLVASIAGAVLVVRQIHHKCPKWWKRSTDYDPVQDGT